MSDVLHCSHLELAARLRAEGRTVDTLIVDAPYSERTHSGHDAGSANAARTAGTSAHTTWRGDPVQSRRSIAYTAWAPVDVAAFVEAWSPLTTGWIVSITDHVLAAHWATALEAQGRYVFAPLPLYSPGSRVRLSGDGPSSWTCWIVVARPATREFFRWGTLPGGYQCAPERMPVVGGKPLAAMRALVRDYSRPGDLVCDPCCGGGTTLLAAQLEGRRYLGCDLDAAHVEITRRRLDGRDPIAGAQTDLWDALAREQPEG